MSVTIGDRARITWVDHARGIGIFLVVLGHTLRGLEASRIIADGPAFRLTDAWIYRFHMPLFFLLSGLFAERRVDRGAVGFVRDKLATLAYPYLVWSVLQTLVQFATSRYANHKPSLSDLAWILVEPILQFWFLYALFLISLFYYALRRMGLGPVGVLAVFAAWWASRGWVRWSGWWPLEASRDYGIFYALGSALNRLGWTGHPERAPSAALIATVILGYGAVTASVARSIVSPPFLGLGATLCGIAASVALATLLVRASGRILSG